MVNWTEYEGGASYLDVAHLARGRYQDNILRGRENVSGSLFIGKAKVFGARYKESREALFSRLREAGFTVTVVTARYNRKILVIGKAGSPVKYVGEAYGKSGRRVYLTGPCSTHEEAALAAGTAAPKASRITSCRAHKIGNKWMPAHIDIRSHTRDELMRYALKGKP